MNSIVMQTFCYWLYFERKLQAILLQKNVTGSSIVFLHGKRHCLFCRRHYHLICKVLQVDFDVLEIHRLTSGINPIAAEVKKV